MSWTERRLTLLGVIIFPVLASIYTTLVYVGDADANEDLPLLYDAAWLLLVALWVVADSKRYPRIYRPFEYGFLVYVYIVLYVPYYLIVTRRWYGALLLVALVSLNWLPLAAPWAAYFILVQ